MTTNATAIRDAIFDRLSTVQQWQLTRKIDVPTLAATDLPALQVFLISESMSPMGDANVTEPKFTNDVVIGISVLRGFQDPKVLDGSIDDDVSAFLDKLLSDASFIRGDSNFYFEGITRVTRRRLFPQQGETYFIELRLEMTFQFHTSYPPVLVNWFEEIKIDFQHGVFDVVDVARAYEGHIIYNVFGASTGAHGAPSGAFRVMPEAEATFTGDMSITVGDGGAGGTFTPSVGSPHAGYVTVTPPNASSGFSFTYTPPSAGAFTLTFSNAQGWVDPAPIDFTAT